MNSIVKHIFALIAAIAVCNALKAQVSNVDFTVNDDNTIEITYSLDHLANIMVSASVGGGESRYISNLSGDFGYNIQPGERKTIIWDVLKSYPAGLRTQNLVITVKAELVATPEEQRKINAKQNRKEWWNGGKINVVALCSYNFYAQKPMFGGRVDFNDKTKTVGFYGKFVSTFNSKPSDYEDLYERDFNEYSVDVFKAFSVTAGFQIGSYNNSNSMGIQWWMGGGYGQRDYYAYDGKECYRNCSRSIKAVDLETGFTLSFTRIVFNIGLNIPLAIDNDSYYQHNDIVITPELEFGVGFRF